MTLAYSVVIQFNLCANEVSGDRDHKEKIRLWISYVLLAYGKFFL